MDRENVKKKLKKIWPIVIKRDGIDKLKLRKIIFSNLYEKQTAKIIISFSEKRKINLRKKSKKKILVSYSIKKGNVSENN